jgi:SOS-response transcriptional repressor LexA
MIPNIKHYFTSVNHQLLPASLTAAENKVMIDSESETDSVRRRLNMAINNSDVTKAELAVSFDISPQAVGQWFKTGRVSKTKLPRLAKLLGVDLNWLLGDQLKDNFAHVNVSPVLGKTDKVPLISFVQAGAWAEAIDNFQPGDAEDWITCPAAHGPHTYALTVDGDSMTASYGRTFPHGCTIYVDPDQVSGVKSSDCVIAKHNGDDTVTFKVFIEDAGRKFLKPLNPQYLVITEEFHVIGKVIGKFEKV